MDKKKWQHIVAYQYKEDNKEVSFIVKSSFLQSLARLF